MSNNKTANTGGTVRGGGNGKRESKRHSQHNTSRLAGQPIYAANGKTIIGSVDGGVFTKHVKQSLHMLRTPPAWAIDIASLDQLHAAGAERIVIHDTETGKKYSASLAHFERHCSKPFNRGFGRQVFLVLGHWQVDGQSPELGGGKEPEPDTPRQLSLFEVGT